MPDLDSSYLYLLPQFADYFAQVEVRNGQYAVLKRGGFIDGDVGSHRGIRKDARLRRDHKATGKSDGGNDSNVPRLLHGKIPRYVYSEGATSILDEFSINFYGESTLSLQTLIGAHGA